MGILAPFRSLALATTVSAVVLLAAAVPALAVDDPAAAEAKKRYEEGTKAFNLGEYPRAIAEFKATYNAKPDPLLLYNIAQSYRLGGDAGQALFFYKSFLRNMPSASNRKEVEGRIRTLEKQVAEQRREPAGSGSPAPTVVPMIPSEPPPAPPGGATTPPSAATNAGGSTPAPATVGAVEGGSGPSGKGSDKNDGRKQSQDPSTTEPPVAGTSSSSTQIDLTAPAPAAEQPSRPIYKKWWFWVGTAGAVLLIGAVAAANAKKGPNTALGTYDPDFMP